jgi:hypothetical protein
MPKRKPREVTGFEKELIALLDAGSIEMSRTKEIFDGRAGFCITFMTRGATSSIYDDLPVAVADSRTHRMYVQETSAMQAIPEGAVPVMPTFDPAQLSLR